MTTQPGNPLRVFDPLPAWEVRSLAGPVVEVNVPAGRRLVPEGRVIGTFFVIRAGQADLFARGHKVGKLGSGDCFGEIDPAPTRPQPFTVIASTQARVMTFSAFGIGRLCSAMPGARERILDALPESEAPPKPMPSAREHQAERLHPIRTSTARASRTSEADPPALPPVLLSLAEPRSGHIS
jgi:hypothetical protein